MKLRLRQNSVRLRLSKADVDHLRGLGECREAIHFPEGSRLEYILNASQILSIRASFANGVISISVPRLKLEELYSTDQIAIRAEVAVAASTTLEVLIEKDFKCLNLLGAEDQANMFENPGGTSCNW